jgi:hypothetical protein
MGDYPMTTVIIRKDSFNSTTKPWTADLGYNGKTMKSFASGFKTFKSLRNHIELVLSMANIDYRIERRMDLDK